MAAMRTTVTPLTIIVDAFKYELLEHRHSESNYPGPLF